MSSKDYTPMTGSNAYVEPLAPITTDQAVNAAATLYRSAIRKRRAKTHDELTDRQREKVQDQVHAAMRALGIESLVIEWRDERDS